MLFKCFKIIFICFRHGINPFSSIGKNIEKMSTRFSEKEKRFFVNSCKNEYLKVYLKKVIL